MKKTGVRDQESGVGMKKSKRPSLAEDVADGLLGELVFGVGYLKRIQSDINEEIDGVRAKYAETLSLCKNRIQDLERQLTALMKTHRDELFADKDKVELMHGLLLYARGPYVSIPRNALGKIEEMGWIEAVRVAKSVARDVVQQWPDERLAIIGAKRTVKETFSYELAA